MALSGFVQRQDQQLVLNGRPFRIVGANNYYLGFVSEDVVREVLNVASAMSLNTIRILACFESIEIPPGPGSVYFHFWNPATNWPDIHDGPDGLDRLDRAVAMAGDSGFRLILTLTNNWEPFGGMPAYTKWFGLDSKDRFYTDGRCRAAYWQWVEQLILRQNKITGRLYRDEPAILGWELANEPDSPQAGLDAILSWTWEMASLIKSKDPNHLVSVGDQGYFLHSHSSGNDLFDGSHGVSYEHLLGVGPVDFGTFHMYPQDMAKGEDPGDFGRMWIGEHVAAAQRANKPAVLEEYGLRVGDAGVADSAARNALYQGWLQDVADLGAAGDLVWMIGLPKSPEQPFAPDAYVLYSADDATSIREHARGFGFAT